MHSTLVGVRAGRMAISLVAASLALAACRGDGMTGQVSSCTEQPGCDATSEPVTPVVLDALHDAGTRLTGALHAETASALIDRLDQLAAALTKRDRQAGGLALAATYDMLGFAERSTPEARADIDAIRLSLIPAARALGMSTSSASSATP